MAGGDGSEAEASGVRNSQIPQSPGGAILTGSQLVNTLQGHVDDIRSRLQCGICIRPLYEPFSLACGHTFCYTVSGYPSLNSYSVLVLGPPSKLLKVPLAMVQWRKIEADMSRLSGSRQDPARAGLSGK